VISGIKLISSAPARLSFALAACAVHLITFFVQCHRAGVVHGDIKSNNVLVTSWNWLVLADFTGLKPAYLPEDNPADLSFFFDVSPKR
jgi:phosphoinositide-3-kinase regulatory subunit 4